MINNFGWDFAAANSDNNAKLYPKLASRKDTILKREVQKPREIKIVHKHVHLVDGKIGNKSQQINKTTLSANVANDEQAALELVESIKASNNKIVLMINRLQSEAAKKNELIKKIRDATNNIDLKKNAKEMKDSKNKQKKSKTQLEKELNKAKSLEKKADNEMSKKINEITNLKYAIAQHQKAIRSLQSSVISLTKGQNATTKTIRTTQKQQPTAAQQTAVRNAQVKITEYKKLYEQEKSKYNMKVSEYNALKNTCSKHQNAVCAAKTEVAIRGTRQEKEVVKAELNTTKQTVEQKLVTQTKKVQTKQQRLNQLKAQLIKLETRLKVLEAELAKLKRVETFGNNNSETIKKLEATRIQIQNEINKIRAEIIKMQGSLAGDIKETKVQQAKLREVKGQQAKVESAITKKPVVPAKASKAEVKAAIAVEQGTINVVKTKQLVATRPEAAAARKAIAVATKPITTEGKASIVKATQGHDWVHQHLVDKHGYKEKPKAHRHTGGQEYNTDGGKGTYKYDFNHIHADDKAGHTHKVGPDGKPLLAKPVVAIRPEDTKEAKDAIKKITKPEDAKSVVEALKAAKPEDAKVAVEALVKKPTDAKEIAVALQKAKVEQLKKEEAVVDKKIADAQKILNDPKATPAQKAAAKASLESAKKQKHAIEVKKAIMAKALLNDPNATPAQKAAAKEALLEAAKKGIDTDAAEKAAAAIKAKAAAAARALALSKYKNGTILRLKSSFNKYVGLDKNGRNVKAGTEKENTELVITRIRSIADNAIALYNRVTKRYIRARNNRRIIDQSGVQSEDYMAVPKNSLLVFYIEPLANNKVAFRTSHDTYLQMDKRFKVRQSGFVPKGKQLPIKWTREVYTPIHLGRMEQKVDMLQFDNALIRLQTNKGTYVTAHENTGHVTQHVADTRGLWRSIRIKKFGYNCIALTSPSTKRLLRAHRNKREIDQSGIARDDNSIPDHWDWVRFYVQKQDNGTFSLLTQHKTYMTTPNDSLFMAQKEANKVGGQRPAEEQYTIVFEEKAKPKPKPEPEAVKVESEDAFNLFGKTLPEGFEYMGKFVNGAVIRLVAGNGEYANIAKDGKIGISKEEIGSTWIVKTLEKQGGNIIALYNKDSQKYIASSSDRKTIIQSKKVKSYNNSKKIKKQIQLAVGQTGQGFTLKTKQGTYIQADGSVINQSEVERKDRKVSKGSSWNVKVLGRVIQRINVAKFKYSQVLRIKTADGKYLSMSDDGSNTKKEDEESEYNLFEIIFLKKHGYNCMAFYNKKTERFLRAHRNKKTFSQTGKPDNYKSVPDTWNWIRFFVEKQDGGKYSIRTSQATYMSKGNPDEVRQAQPGKLGGQRPSDDQLTLVLKLKPVVPEQVKKQLPANWKTGSKLRLKTWRNTYVSVSKDGSSKQGGAGAYETFIVKVLPQFGGNCVALYGYHKKFLRAHANRKNMDQSGSVASHDQYPSGWQWERFFVEELKDGKIALRTYHDTYVRANPNGMLDQSKVIQKGLTLDKMDDENNKGEGFTGKGEDYRGKQDKTITGKTCMNWTKQDPHKHGNTPDKKPTKGLGDHNQCRNPDGNKEIWCYTNDKNSRWEACKPLNESFTGKGEDYRGKQNETISGKTCMNWTKQDPHKHDNTPEKKPNKGLGDHNFCRNPDGNKEMWCYTTDKNKRWESCKPIGNKKCNEDLVGDGSTYRGCQDKTVNGRLCQNWSKDTPHKKSDQNAKAFKEKAAGLGDHNFCRNPDGEKEIWCYTADKDKRWEKCSPIPSGWVWEKFTPVWLYVPGSNTTPVGKPIGHFVASEYKNDKTWKNKVTNGKHTVQWRGNAQVQNYQNGNTKFQAIKFEKDDGVRFPPEMSAPSWSVVIVARNRRNGGRVLEGTNNNVLAGWWGNRVGVTHQGHWQTWRDYAWGLPKQHQQRYRNSWHIMAITNNGRVYIDGSNVSCVQSKGKTPAQWAINSGEYVKNEWVQCDVAEVLFWDLHLNHEQLVQESNRMSFKYGIRSAAAPMIIEKIQKATIDGSPVGHFTADSFNRNYNWVNLVGGKPNITEFIGAPVVVGRKYRGKTFKVVNFNRVQGCRLHKDFISNNFTLIVVGRNRRNTGRVIDGTTGNFLHGWWAGKTGVFHQGRWISRPASQGDKHGFHIMSATNNGDCWHNGMKVTKWKRRASANPRQISINWGQFHHGEWVDCDIAEIVVYNRNLSETEAATIHRKLVEKYAIDSLMDVPAIMTKLIDGSKLRLKSHRGTYIMMHGNGAHVKQGGAGQWEIFEVKRASRHGASYISLFGYHGRYLSAHSNKKNMIQSGRISNGRYNDIFKNKNKKYWELYKVEDVGNGQLAFRTVHNTYIRAHNNGWTDQSAVTQNKKLPTTWKWERFTPMWMTPSYMDIFFREGNQISLKTWKNSFVQHLNGKVAKHSDKAKGTPSSYVFAIKRLPRFGLNCIALFNTGDKKFIGMSPSGKVYLSPSKKDYNDFPLGWAWQRFWVEETPVKGKYAFRTYHDTYLAAHPNTSMTGTELVHKLRTPPMFWQWHRFEVVALGGAIMSKFENGTLLRLKTWRGNYMQLHSNNTGRQGGAGVWELFKVKRVPKAGANCIALYSWHKTYLWAMGDKRRVGSNGAKRKDYNDFPSDWYHERFFIEDIGKGQIALRTHHNTYLRAHSNGTMDQSPQVPVGKPIPSNWKWERFTPVFIKTPKAQFVHVQASPGQVLHIREFRVMDFNVNVAFKKPVKGSATAHGGHHSKMVDGQFPGRWPNSNHTHANGWAQIDLKKEYPIYEIKVWNRPDCCKGRLGGAVVSLKDSKNKVIWKQTLTPDYYQWWQPGKVRWNPVAAFNNGRKISLYTICNRTVYAHSRWNWVRQHPRFFGWSTFTVKTLPKYGKNCIALFNNAHKRFLKAEGNKRNITQSPQRAHFNDFPMGWQWERLWVENVGNGRLAFRTVHGTYIKAAGCDWLGQSPVRPKGQSIHPTWEAERFLIHWR